MPLTTSQPKGFTEISGKSILDWTLKAFNTHGPFKHVYIAGYLSEVVMKKYPNFQFVKNDQWSTTNILFSLNCARDYMKNGFYSSYTDTLFKDDAVALLKQSQHDITVVMDTDWRNRYKHRSQHPESDAEKMIVDGNKVGEISRTIDPVKASGEFTGVLKMNSKGAKCFLEFYDSVNDSLGLDGIFTEDKPFRLAYLIHLFNHMIKNGVDIHYVPVHGNYHEIDTLQDYELAKKEWEINPND
tara:strand:- start:1641 stop:2366 length:726 start_codon:yes stop_codon:yes gene_type:complete